jgi:peptidoglycan/LPS O-acetylase OafA/YrhL
VAHKARAILPFYLAACALTPLIRLATDRSLTLEYFALRMPSLLFLQRTGLGKPFIGCTWYISSMLIGLVLAYPLCRRFYRFYTCFAGPVLGFALLGAIMVLTGGLGDIDDWFFITYKTNVRAFAEISVGAGTFEISRRISTWFARRKADLRLLVCRWILTLTALTGLALSVAYMCSAIEGCYALIVVCLLSAAVAIVFSGQGVLCHAGIFTNPVFAYLGRISLPMYVSQTLFRRSVPYWFDRSSEWKQCLMIYLGILLFAMLMDGTARLCRGRRVRIPVRLYRRKIS